MTGFWAKAGAVTAAGVAVWALATAEAKSPGVVPKSIGSAADTLDAAATGSIRVIKGSANEATSPPIATTTTVVAEGGDDSGTG